jgi:hypothetical protein
MKHHSELLNLIAKKINAEKYLEIGVFNPAHNFNLIDVPYKKSVDPDPNAKAIFLGTSDDFFYSNTETFDLIWIDGLHHAEQVKKDIINAWDCLNKGGVIVVHDSNPHSERITHVPRDNREWTGDVYKTICQIVSPKITVDFDYGCCVITDKPELSNKKITWDYFDKNRKQLLNLVSVEEAKKIIDTFRENTINSNEVIPGPCPMQH